ncbi:hypothetical protein [Sterolibacterium denitrificans]|nr:hypothetical protein [Sterolibacterium denitrificans]
MKVDAMHVGGVLSFQIPKPNGSILSMPAYLAGVPPKQTIQTSV